MGFLIKWIRFILFGFVLMLAGLFGIVLALFRPFHKDISYYACQIIKFFAPGVLGIKIEVENEQWIADNRPCIFISNHQNNFDIVMASNVIARGTVSLGKKQIIYIPIFGLFYWLAGNVMIDRGNRRKALESMNIAKKALNEKGTSIWIMPEGTRSYGRGILPFKKGAFHTAVECQAKIVPIVISDLDKSWDPSMLKTGHVKIKVLSPIETKGLGKTDITGLKDQCEELFKKTFAELNTEVVSLEQS